MVKKSAATIRSQCCVALSWVVERSFAWLNQFRRLRLRYEKRADIHKAFLALGCTLICWRFLAP